MYVWRIKTMQNLKKVQYDRNIAPGTMVSNEAVKLSRPPVDFVKINTDATWKMNERGGIGAIIRDEAGQAVFAAAAPTGLTASVEAAELLAILLGLETAWNWCYRHIILETDNLSIARVINGGGLVDCSVSILLDEVKVWLPNFDSVTVNHVKRSANVTAHELAKWGVFLDNHVLFVEEVPTFLVNFVQADICNSVPD
ncbi:uncharacterized protein [Euphorbia lathyris]|uniref:uncharacterized protein n=1 Tax=Euphorbia lathyris TaxID=212925 RepID=UPI003313EF99